MPGFEFAGDMYNKESDSDVYMRMCMLCGGRMSSRKRLA